MPPDHLTMSSHRRRVLTIAVACASVFGLVGVSMPRAAADTPTPTWTQLSPSTSPYPSVHASMAYDSGTGQLVLFGGYGAGGTYSNTWTWNGSTWTEQFPATSPSARNFASMAYDPGTGQLVLFGGVDSNSGNEFADTWTWNGSDWTELTPSTSPLAR